MELTHLRYFLHVAESGSFVRGASRAHVSAPAMTKAIGKLEGELGVRLFERTTRRIALTDEGRALLARAHAVVDQVGEITRDLEELRSTISGELRIGAMEVFSMRLLPRAIAALVAEAPKVVPLVYEMHPDSMQRHLAEGLLDVGLTIGAPTSSEIDVQQLGTSPGRVVCGRTHALYAKGRITRAALARHPFVVPRFFQQEHLPSLDQFPDDVHPRRVGATIELLQMMAELVIAGSFLGYFPEISILDHLSTGALRALSGLPGLPTFGLHAWTRRGVRRRRATDALIAKLRDMLAPRHRSG